MSRGPDAHTLLLRALVADAATRGLAVDVPESDWLRWASATFTGARHSVTLSGKGLDEWLARLPEHEFTLRGHLVADVTVTGVRHAEGMTVATLELLTLEER